jgi:hypothetical protein
MYFSGNGSVETGQARYETRVYSGKLSYLGNTYELVYPNRPSILTNILNKTTLILPINETRSFNGYVFSYNDTIDKKIRLIIRKQISKYQKDLLNQALDFNKSFYPDIMFQMFLREDNNYLKKTNIFKINDSFEYWEEYRSQDQTYKKIAGEFIERGNNSIELNVRFYDIPLEIFPGKLYNEFYVEGIDNRSIIIRNNVPLQFKPGTETSILGGSLKIKTSSNDFLAYPEK